MRGLVLERGRVRVVDDLPEPVRGPGESLVRVTRAGVCATDLALQRGYMGFRGVPGHEFVGVALEGPYAGRRVVGEINATCGACPECEGGEPRHCRNRTVLGIAGRPGAFAEYLALPDANLHPVPDAVPDDAAVFTEPLAAAYEIPARVAVPARGEVLVLGDGRLGLLCAQVLADAGAQVTLGGRHPERASWLAGDVRHVVGVAEGDAPPERRWPLVVEATGRPETLPRALALTAPRGTLVLKTTTEAPVALDLAPLVVDEIRLEGSRCGPFPPALQALADGRASVLPMIQDRYPLGEGERALARAAEPGVLKVLIDVS